jgi:hypothetical protein
MKKLLILTLIFILAGVILHSCKKDNGDPPVLPPAGSMIIDFDNFESAKKGLAFISIPKGTLNSNWDFAADAAIIWKTIIYSNLIIPVTSFQMAVNQAPVYADNKTWEWSYDASVLNVTYKARLTGQITSSEVLWKMYITKEGTGGYTDFLWFKGTSEIDGTGGQWILNQSPQNPEAVLQIDWTKVGEAVGMVKYTYIKAGDAFKDSYIQYGLTTQALNAYYTIHYYNSSYQQFYDLNVEWSTTLHNGRVKCAGHFGTSDWYCWDGNFLNVTCP